MRTKMIDAYRKCGRCGEKSADIKKSKCKCGGYMAVISSVYMPVVRKRGKR